MDKDLNLDLLQATAVPKFRYLIANNLGTVLVPTSRYSCKFKLNLGLLVDPGNMDLPEGDTIQIQFSIVADQQGTRRQTGVPSPGPIQAATIAQQVTIQDPEQTRLRASSAAAVASPPPLVQHVRTRWSPSLPAPLRARALLHLPRRPLREPGTRGAPPSTARWPPAPHSKAGASSP
eukprot:SAG31_NODE_999_length_10457_cov_3.482622_11_plen_177_part_00